MFKKSSVIILLIGILQLVYFAAIIIYYALRGYLLLLYSHPLNIIAFSIEPAIGILFILLAIFFNKE